MATRPDGKPAKTERVTFTRPAAERIAKVVRTVEGGDRDTGPLTFAGRGLSASASGKLFRVCTFTGNWSIGEVKPVAFKYSTTTPNTVVATNLFFPVSVTTTSTAHAVDCGIAKDGTGWFLISLPFATATAVFASRTTTGIVITSTQSTGVLTDFTLSATLNTNSCVITLGKTLVTSSSVFVSGTATAIFMQSTFTSSFLRLGV